VAFVVAAEAPVAADPLDDIERPGTGLFYERGHLPSLIATVPNNAFDEGEALASLLQQGLRNITVLHAGGVHIDVQQQAERVDENMALAPEDFLARIVPLRIKRGPPFTAPLALWASMIAVVGLASRPAVSRHAT
jgi:hypothetical protein